MGRFLVAVTWAGTTWAWYIYPKMETSRKHSAIALGSVFPTFLVVCIGLSFSQAASEFMVSARSRCRADAIVISRQSLLDGQNSV
jgi:hypothetical protein